MLNVNAVLERSVNYMMELIDFENCCQMFELAKSRNLINFIGHCESFILKNFSKIVKNKSYLELSSSSLASLLGNNSIDIENETVLFTAVCDWIIAKESIKAHEVSPIMKQLRSPLIKQSQYNTLMDSLKKAGIIFDDVNPIGGIDKPREYSDYRILLIGGCLDGSTDSRATDSVECFSVKKSSCKIVSALKENRSLHSLARYTDRLNTLYQLKNTNIW